MFKAFISRKFYSTRKVSGTIMNWYFQTVFMTITSPFSKRCSNTQYILNQFLHVSYYHLLKSILRRIENHHKKLANDHKTFKPKADVYGFENMLCESTEMKNYQLMSLAHLWHFDCTRLKVNKNIPQYDLIYSHKHLVVQSHRAWFFF